MYSPTLLELFKYFFILGATTFGGPLSIIDTIRFDLVLKKNWMSIEEFKNIFGYSQVAPGPLAFQVVLYYAYYRKGFIGAIISGFALVLPSYLLVLLFSIFYKQFNDVSYIRASLYGLSPVIIAIIAKSGYNLSKTIFQKDIFLYILFSLSVFLTLFYKIQILYNILGIAALALIYYSIKEKKFSRNNLNTFIFSNFIISGFKKLFIGSSFILFLHSRLIEMAGLFLKVGALTYGSGFVIVGVLRQEVVDKLHWLTAKEFLDGIAFGQITPGPVVITSTFIGYMTSGFLGSVVATVCIFLPTFIIIMILAQRIHKYKDNFYLQSLIKGANAAAIGAILSTAFLLSKDALLDLPTVIIFLISIGILFTTKFKEIYLIIIFAFGGILIKLFI